ncbi:MAG: hypothetical protein DCC75_12220 [Proteobacteria bacterium]|nr:MAG: hypothetical protein DCC75_12220 [Pseudomonadota bacterium]
MAKKPKNNLTKKLLIIGGSLAAVLVVLILYFGQATQPVNIREELDKKASQVKGLSQQRRQMLKIQLAIADFRISNNKLPESLDELRPVYFDSVPIDPETGKPFSYKVEGAKYVLGEKKTAPTLVAAAGASTQDAVLSGEAQQEALIASLDDKVETVAFVYDPSEKRDPFIPFDLSAKLDDDPNKTPLERYELGQLRLTAVLAGLDEPTATVENAVGKGFLVKKGAKIGTNNGEVVEILQDRIKILETSVDFTGQTKTNVVELVLRTKDQISDDVRDNIKANTRQQRP